MYVRIYLIRVGQQASTLANEVNEDAADTLQPNDGAPSPHLRVRKARKRGGGESREVVN